MEINIENILRLILIKDLRILPFVCLSYIHLPLRTKKMAAMMLLGFSAILLFQSSSSLACDTSSCQTEFTELTCREIICSIFKPMPDVTSINIINRFRGVLDLRGTSVNRVNFQPDIFIERSPCKQVLISRPVLVNDHRCMEVRCTYYYHCCTGLMSTVPTH